MASAIHSAPQATNTTTDVAVVRNSNEYRDIWNKVDQAARMIISVDVSEPYDEIAHKIFLADIDIFENTIKNGVNSDSHIALLSSTIRTRIELLRAEFIPVFVSTKGYNQYNPSHWRARGQELLNALAAEAPPTTCDCVIL